MIGLYNLKLVCFLAFWGPSTLGTERGLSIGNISLEVCMSRLKVYPYYFWVLFADYLYRESVLI